MQRYTGEKRILVATDCIIFGFDGWDIKLLLVQRAIEPEKNKWSLMEISQLLIIQTRKKKRR